MMNIRRQQTITAFQDFFSTPLAQRLTRHQQIDAKAQALSLFCDAAEAVPAYRSWLQAQGVDPANIRSTDMLAAIPLMTKQNYMRAYPLAERCRQGALSDCDMLAFSSGSTGTPMVWPRTVIHELDITYRFEQIFHVFHSDQRDTLAVICFALGTWVGGMFTAACCRHLASKGYRITVVTPGNKKEEIFRVVKELAPAYEQVVLLGYPPFIKDVIDGGSAEGLDWPAYKPKLVFAGEVFSEEWRTLVCERIGSTSPAQDTASLYGTADGGVLGNETPLSIAIRRFFAERPALAREVFGESRLPTLVQYDPLSRYFEVHDGTLVVSGDNGVPLVRYHIADQGGIIAYEKMLAIIRREGLEPSTTASDRGHWPLPFVYLFGRADFTVSFYGANVYPENISVGLEQAEVRHWVSGKFVLQIVETTDRNEALGITVELLPGVTGDDTKRDTLAQVICRQVLRLNSEYANYVPQALQLPQLTLKPFGDPAWFPTGVKHRYTRKK